MQKIKLCFSLALSNPFVFRCRTTDPPLSLGTAACSIVLLHAHFHHFDHTNADKSEPLKATAAPAAAVTPPSTGVGAERVFLEGLFTQRRRFASFMVWICKISS